MKTGKNLGLAMVAVLGLIIFATSANGGVIFSDDFESGSLAQWIVGGRQLHSHGGMSIAEIVNRNGSQMAHLHQSDFTEITIEKMFDYNPCLTFSFDMKISVSSDAGLTDDDYASAGAYFDFLDSSEEVIGTVRYIHSTSSYPFTTYNSAPHRQYIALPDNGGLQSYTFNIQDILSNIEIDTNSIASVNFYFNAYNSGWGHNMSSDVWVDNITVNSELADIAVISIQQAIAEKEEALERVDAALEKEWAAYDALEELLESGDYGDLSRRDVFIARRKILPAIQQEEQAIDALGKSIEKLRSALTALGLEPEMDPNLAAYWKFDEGQGDTAYDSAGDNDGTIYGAEWTTGQVDGALSFDGDDDYVNLDAHIGDYENLSTGTLCIWIKKENTGNVGIFFSSSDGGDNYSSMYFAKMPDEKIKIRISENNTSKLYWNSDSVLPFGWHHFAYTTDSSGHSVYLDGVPLTGSYTVGSPSTSAFFSHIPNQDTIRIGNLHKTDNDYFHWDGLIDEVAIYNRALSADQIQQLYQDALGGQGKGKK